MQKQTAPEVLTLIFYNKVAILKERELPMTDKPLRTTKIKYFGE